MARKPSSSRIFDRKLARFLSLLGFTIAVLVGGYSLYVTYPSFSTDPTPVLEMLSKGQKRTATARATCGSNRGGETDNPILTRYGESSYPWTTEIRWHCVYNINDFEGNTTIDRFNAARDTAAAHGGGVVYFPAGTYEFTDSIELKNGVVVRGETPRILDAKDKTYDPPTKLVFPKYEPQFAGNGTPNETAFKKISTSNPDRDSNIGIVNVDLNRAAISWVGDLDAGKQHNIVVFGVRSNNVAEPDPKVPDRSFQAPWIRYSYRFAANIKINGDGNILVANNRINDEITDNYPQPGYPVKSVDGKSVVTYSDGDRVPFHYGNHYGSVVNRSKANGFKKAATPQMEPGLFRPEIVIRDNWVYHTMRVAISASGKGLEIRDNQIEDEPNKQWWTDPTGMKEAKGSVTLENRAIDWSGWDVEIEGNRYEVYRHKIGDTGYLSVDGEGILIQECCGGTTVNGATIVRNSGNAYIGLYKVRDIQQVMVDENILSQTNSNIESIYVVADTNSTEYSMEDVTIENNQIEGGILVKASAGGQNNKITNNQGNNSGLLKYSCHVTVSGNRGFQQKPCLVTDGN